MKINVDELLFEFKFRDDDDNFPAQMTLMIGQIQIRGFAIRKTQLENADKKYVMFPPSVPAGHNKWIKIFWTDDKECWSLIQEKALKQFEKEHTAYTDNININTL